MTDPHPHDEDPEEHIGDEIPDPWDDEGQTDWPNNPEVSDGGPGPSTDELP